MADNPSLSRTQIVYFSGKITHSFVNYILRKGSDLERFYEVMDLPTEFVRDPSCWLDAEQVETFIEAIEKEYASRFGEQNLVESVGHSCAELRAWGVLDSVLRMMQKPQDIFLQPQRFISYFVSPAPPIANFERMAETISFDLPISSQEYPYVTEYLRAAMEALPLYIGRQMSSARWSHTAVQVSWSEAQKNFLPESDLQPNIKPELMQTMVESLELAQKDLEEHKKKLVQKDREIERLKTEIDKRQMEEAQGCGQNSTPPLVPDLLPQVEDVQRVLFQLSDYLARAHQLVTLLVKQDRMDRQVKQAMHRVDWELITTNYTGLTKQAADKITTMKRFIENPEKAPIGRPTKPLKTPPAPLDT